MDLKTYLIVAAIMAAAGLLGGTVNHLGRAQVPAADGSAKEALSASPGWLADISVSLLAAFVTPLFLSLAKSALFDDVVLGLAGDKPIAGDAFVFFGFCLVAAFSARVFVNNLSQTVLGLVAGQRNLNTRVEEVEEEVAEETDPIPTLGEPDVLSGHDKAATPRPSASLSPNAHHVLTALVSRPFTWRSVAGVRKQVGLSRETAASVLEGLVREEFVDSKPSRNDSILYRITAAGRQALGLEPLVQPQTSQKTAD